MNQAHKKIQNWTFCKILVGFFQIQLINIIQAQKGDFSHFSFSSIFHLSTYLYLDYDITNSPAISTNPETQENPELNILQVNGKNLLLIKIGLHLYLLIE